MLIVLHGEDSFSSMRALEEIKEKFKREVDPSGSSISVINSEEDNALEILQSAMFAPSLFSRRRLVIFKKALEAPAAFKNILTDILAKDSSGGEHIIVVWEDRKIGAKAKAKKPSKNAAKTKVKTKESSKKLEQILLDSPYVKYFSELFGKELIQWIELECKKIGAKIEAAAAREMAERIGSDLWKLQNELRKLSALTQKNITLPSVKLNIPIASEQTVFEVLDGIISGNTHFSLRAAERLLESGTSFQEFFAILTGQFRNIWEAKAGMVRPDIHPFARKKALENSRRFSDDKIKSILNVLVEADSDLKTTALSPFILLDRLIVKIAEAARKTT